MSDKSNTTHDYSIESEEEAYEKIKQLFKDCAGEGTSKKIDLHKKLVRELAIAVDNEDIDGDANNGTANEIANYIGENSSRLKSEYIIDELDTKLYEVQESKTLPLNKWLWEHVSHIDKIKSSDSDVDTKYLWEIESGETFYTRGEHNEWTKLFNLLSDVNIMFDFTKPDDDYTDGFKWVYEFMKPFMQSKIREEIEFEGTRSDTIDEIQKTIQSRIGYTNPEDAYKGTGIYVENDNVFILNKIVKHIADKHGEKPRTIQIEFYEKQITYKKKISHKKKIENGHWMKFWKVPLSFAEPKEIVDEEEGGEEIESATRGGLV